MATTKAAFARAFAPGTGALLVLDLSRPSNWKETTFVAKSSPETIGLEINGPGPAGSSYRRNSPSLEVEIVDARGTRVFHDTVPVDSPGPDESSTTTGVGPFYPTKGERLTLRARTGKPHSDFKGVRTALSIDRPFQVERQTTMQRARTGINALLYCSALLFLAGTGALLTDRLSRKPPTENVQLMVTLLAAAGAVALVAMLVVVVIEALDRDASRLSFSGFEDPAGLQRLTANEQIETRHYWLKMVFPLYAFFAVLLWFVFWKIKPASRRLNLVIFIVTIIVAAHLKLSTAGWMLLTFAMLFYPALFIAQVVLNIGSLKSASAPTAWLLAPNVLFLLAILLQFDIGDGYGSLTITALLGDGPGGSLSPPPQWVPGSVVYNALLFVPVAIGWIAIGMRTARNETTP